MSQEVAEGNSPVTEEVRGPRIGPQCGHSKRGEGGKAGRERKQGVRKREWKREGERRGRVKRERRRERETENRGQMNNIWSFQSIASPLDVEAASKSEELGFVGALPTQDPLSELQSSSLILTLEPRCVISKVWEESLRTSTLNFIYFNPSLI